MGIKKFKTPINLKQMNVSSNAQARYEYSLKTSALRAREGGGYYSCRPEMEDSPLAYSSMPHEKDEKIYLGLEWEARWNRKGDIGTQKERRETNAKMWSYFNHDKLRNYILGHFDHGDIELTTIPCTLGFHKDILRRYFQRTFAYQSIKSDKKNKTDTGIGIHVHVDAQAFTKTSYMKLLAFMYMKKNKVLLEQIAERKIDGSHYNKPVFKYYEENAVRDQVFNMDDKGNVKSTKVKFKKHLKPSQYESVLYRNIPDSVREAACKGNIVALRGTTVEFRLFKTSPTLAGVYRKLEFSDAMTRFVRAAGWKDLTSECFYDYVVEYKDKYPYLHKFLSTKVVKFEKDRHVFKEKRFK